MEDAVAEQAAATLPQDRILVGYRQFGTDVRAARDGDGDDYGLSTSSSDAGTAGAAQLAEGIYSVRSHHRSPAWSWPSPRWVPLRCCAIGLIS